MVGSECIDSGLIHNLIALFDHIIPYTNTLNGNMKFKCVNTFKIYCDYCHAFYSIIIIIILQPCDVHIEQANHSRHAWEVELLVVEWHQFRSQTNLFIYQMHQFDSFAVVMPIYHCFNSNYFLWVRYIFYRLIWIHLDDTNLLWTLFISFETGLPGCTATHFERRARRCTTQHSKSAQPIGFIGSRSIVR